MAMAVGGSSGESASRHQRHAADRCVVGAADHLHGHHSTDSQGLDALAPQPPPPNQPPPPPDQDPNVVIEIKADHSMQINGDPVLIKICKAALPISSSLAPRRLFLLKGTKIWITGTWPRRSMLRKARILT